MTLWPGKVTAGSINEEIITSVDMLPTLSDVAGFDPSSLEGIHGLSFLPILKGENHVLPERAVFWHFPHNRRPEFDMGAAIREGKWKLIWTFEDDELFLFDVDNDIAETTNLSDDYPEKANDLLNKLKDWQQSVGAIMPQPNPNYQAK